MVGDDCGKVHFVSDGQIILDYGSSRSGYFSFTLVKSSGFAYFVTNDLDEYLHTVTGDFDQRRETQWISAPPRSCRRHFAEQFGLPHSSQKDKNLKVCVIPKF